MSNREHQQRERSSRSSSLGLSSVGWCLRGIEKITCAGFDRGMLDPVIFEEGVHAQDARQTFLVERIEKVMIDRDRDAVVTEFLDDGNRVFRD